MATSVHALANPDSRAEVRATFEKVRASYVRVLASALTGGNLHVEPALRTANGAVAVEGKWQLPYRPDYMDRNTGRSGLVKTPERLSFREVSATYGDCRVEIRPFSWDHALVMVHGITQARLKEVATKWFLQWFDPDDRNTTTTDGLYGVVHFIEEPSDDSRTQFAVDLGSAVAEALDQLLIALAAAGARSVSVA